MNRRVVHVIPFLWSGAGRVVTRLCEEQAARGVDVHIATTGRAGAEGDWTAYRRRLRQAGVTWHRLNTFDRRPESLWPAVERAATLFTALRPDVIHAHAGTPTLIATLATAPFGPRPSPSVPPRPRIIGQMYSWGPNRPGWMDTMDLVGFGRAHRVVVSANQYERLLIQGGVRKSRLAYIPWGVDVPARRCHVDLKLRLPTSSPPVRLGFVGRLEPRKDQLTLVETLAHLVARGVNAHLTLVGPDGDAGYGLAVRASVRARGLSDRVRLAGAVRSIAPYLRRLDAFVSLSKDEGQGLAVLEAMGAGVPVLARPAAGLEDFLVDGQNGVSLHGTAPRALGDAIVRALSDRSRLTRLAAQARQMVERRYTWPATLQALETVYGW
jgi:glycosyltransferase involved in cell wall biosynthesis